MDLYQRRSYLSDSASKIAAGGTIRRDTGSNLEIWCECFGRNMSDLKPADSYTIAALMTQIDGWTRTERIKKLVNYGRQRLYVRSEAMKE